MSHDESYCTTLVLLLSFYFPDFSNFSNVSDDYVAMLSCKLTDWGQRAEAQLQVLCRHATLRLCWRVPGFGSQGADVKSQDTLRIHVIMRYLVWLVVWNIFYFSNIHHPNWLSYFSEGFKPPTSCFLECFCHRNGGKGDAVKVKALGGWGWGKSGTDNEAMVEYDWMIYGMLMRTSWKHPKPQIHHG